MTAKQALREYIEELSEEEAQQMWDRIRDEGIEFAPLTDDDVRDIRRAIEDVEAGRGYTTEDVLRRLGLAD